MKKLLLALALALTSTSATAQTGIFLANTVWGNATGLPAQPKVTSSINFPAAIGTSVLFYGAVCNDTSLSLARIDAQANNLTLIIPANTTCTISSVDTLNFTSGSVVIVGSGPTSVIKAADSAALTQMIATSQTNVLKLKNLVVDGNRANNGTSVSPAYGIIVGASNFSAENVEFKNIMGIAVALLGTPENITISNSWFHDIGYNTSTANNSGVGIFGSNGAAPGANNVRIINNVFEDIHSTVAPVGDSSAINLAATNIIVRGNYFKNNYNTQGGQVAITDNSTGATSLHAVIDGNIIVQTSTFGSEATSGFEVLGSDVVISNNICVGVAVDCYRIEGASSKVIVSSNIAKGFGVAGVNLINTVTKTAVRNNSVFDGPGGFSAQNGAGAGNTLENNYIDTTVGNPVAGDWDTVRLNVGNTTGGVALAVLEAIATNTVVANSSSGLATPSPFAMPSCSTSTSVLIWTTNTGFGCQTTGVTTNGTAAVGQLPGTTTNDSAAAGKVGELLTNTSTAVSLTNSVAKTVTSQQLTAGDWDVSCSFKTTPAGGTLQTVFWGSLSPTNDTLTMAVGDHVRVETAFAATDPTALSTPVLPVSIASGGTPTYYCVLFVAFSVSTLTADAKLVARRVR